MKIQYKLLLFTIILLSFSGCKHNAYRLFIIFDNVEGLSINSEITYEGLKVGRVEAMNIYNNKILVTALIYNNFPIPDNAVFLLESINVLGSKIITINYDDDFSAYYFKNDTIQGQVQKMQIRNLSNLLSDTSANNKLQIMVDSISQIIKSHPENNNK